MDINDISNLNDQLAGLTKDWERHQDAQTQYTNPDQQRKNEQIAAMRQYIPPSTTPPIAHPSIHNYPPVTPSRLAQPPQSQPSRAIYQQSSHQQQPPAYQQATPQIIQTPSQQPQITAGHYQQLPQQVRQLPQQIDPRDTMNERLGNFRFDHAGSTYGMPGLVPVNMDHVYSGNLFSDGLPVPQDLRDQFTLSAPGATQPGARMQHQTKGKTMYRADNNERLAALSPLGRALYYPVSGGSNGQQPEYIAQQPPTYLAPQPGWDTSSQYQQPYQQQQQPYQQQQQPYQQQQQPYQQQQQPYQQQQQPYQQQQQPIDYTSSGLARPQQAFNPALQPQMNTRRSELRADINARMGQHPSLAAASAPETQYINMGSEPYNHRAHNPASTTNQPKKVVYQDMYPVMSK
jgi:hypothetical protein